MAKYIETQFHKSRSESSIVTGPISLLGLAFGFLFSGLAISRYRPRAKYVLLYNVIVGAIYIFGHIGNLFLACSTAEDRLLGTPLTMNLTRDCNVDCSCESVPFSPVCTINGDEAYFSPCHAGCESYDEGTKQYYDCSCLDTFRGISFEKEEKKLGTCLKGCGFGFVIFTSIAAINNFLSASGRIGNTLVNYR